jgi:AhpD family alkylhydroperoxidase
MKIRKKFLDYEYEEVLDGRVRELIRVGCAIAVGCPTWLKKHFAVAKSEGATESELREAIAYGMIAPGGRAKNFALDMLAEMQADGGTENTE